MNDLDYVVRILEGVKAILTICILVFILCIIVRVLVYMQAYFNL